MSRRLARDPARRCMPLAEWPPQDRALRQKALEEDTDDDGDGALAGYRGATIAFLDTGYGRWLQSLDQHGELDPLASPASRVTPARVARYVRELRRVNSTKTVMGRLSALYYMVLAQDPGHDLKFLRRHISRVRRRHQPVRNKYAKIVDVAELYALGLRLMRTAPERSTPRHAAVQFRNGLLISVLAASPVRTRNALMLIIGESVVQEQGRWWIRFSRSEGKTPRAFEAFLPDELAPYIAEYLTSYRPMLLARRGKLYRPPGGNELWITDWGTALVSIYGIVTETTRKELGRPVNPHLFRDCASTSIAIAVPKSVRIVMPVLGHGTLRTSEESYNQARSFEAFGHWHELLANLRGRSRDQPKGKG